MSDPRTIAVLARVEPLPGRPAARLRVEHERAAARAALTEAARRRGVVLGPLLEDELGAPLPVSGRCWSISHGRGWVAAALATVPIGVDTEPVRAARPALVERVLDARERDLVGPGDLAFSLAWTAKEAVLKRAGVGLLELSGCRLVGHDDEGRLVLKHRGERVAVSHHQVRDQVFAVTAGPDGFPRWEKLEPAASSPGVPR